MSFRASAKVASFTSTRAVFSLSRSALARKRENLADAERLPRDGAEQEEHDELVWPADCANASEEERKCADLERARRASAGRLFESGVALEEERRREC